MEGDAVNKRMAALGALLLLSPAAAMAAGNFHYSLEQFALIAGYEDCVREMGRQLGDDQREALMDKLLRERGLSYQPRRVANDRRQWAYPEYGSQRRLLEYMIPANKMDCLERHGGRY